MKLRNPITLCLLAAFVTVGCAKTEITDREQHVTGKLPKPATVWVYDFVATPEALPVDTSLDEEYFNNQPPQSSAHLAEGKQLGEDVRVELVSLLRDMGITAEHAVPGAKQQVNDIIIQGYILSFIEGDAKKRVVIGMGQGASHLKVAAEGLQVTSSGVRVLGSGSMDAGGDKTPGGAVGLAVLAATKNPAGLLVTTGMHAYGEHTGSSKVEGRAKQAAEEIAELLEERFKEQGWI